MRLTAHAGVGHVVEGEQHTLDLCRMNLAAAHVNHLAPTAEDAQPLAIGLDEVARIEEAIGIERARRVQIAEHRGLGTHPQSSVDHLRLVPLTADAHPQGVAST